MSLCLINMYRSVVTFIFFTFICGVISTNETNCQKEPQILEGRIILDKCFADYVHTHVDGVTTEACKTISDFNNTVVLFYKNYTKVCNLPNMTKFNLDPAVEFVEYSINDEHLKDFANNTSCIVEKTHNLTACVKKHTGVTISPRRHSNWNPKARLSYNNTNCRNARAVRACVESVLSTCQKPIHDYVSALFDYTIKKCPPPTDATNHRPLQKEPLMSLPVIIAVSVCSVILLGGIGFAIFYKLTH